MTNLEQSIYDICATHDLIAISLDMHPAHNAPFTCYAHAESASTESGRLCTSGSAETLNEAVTKALAAMAAARGAFSPTLADEPLAA